MADLSTKLEAMAVAHEAEAAMLDHEFPEPDDYCPHAGGDSARATAVMLRRAAAICKAGEEWQAARARNRTSVYKSAVVYFADKEDALDAAVAAGRDKETP